MLTQDVQRNIAEAVQMASLIFLLGTDIQQRYAAVAGQGGDLVSAAAGSPFHTGALLP